jgi:hypothetical protein
VFIAREFYCSKYGIEAEGSAWPLCRARHNGHGYCTYDFFDQCPHRMACAKCSFYLPKDSTKAQLLEAKANLLRLRQEIPLADAELAAVEEGVVAYERLLATLADVPTPEGSTPRQLTAARLVQLQQMQGGNRPSAELDASKRQ